MKTIIKIPLYVEVTTEDGLNRKTISDGIRDYFIPEFFDVVQNRFDLVQYLSSSNLRNLRNSTGPGSKFRLISNSDLFLGEGSKNLFKY
jgi:hypothetical protein